MSSVASISCPCCKQAGPLSSFSIELTTSGRLRNFEIHECGTCKHAWLATDRASHEIIESVYNHDYAGHRLDQHFERRCREEIKGNISRLISPPADLLDVGCGNGSFILAAKENGYDALGIDISAEGVAIANKRGATALNVDFLTHDFGQLFDVITMWDVIEHLREPEIFLTRAKKLLSPDGILIIKTPSIGKPCLQLVRTIKRAAPSLLQTPDHVQFWTKTSMDALLTRTGFTNTIYWPTKAFRSHAKAKSAKQTAKRIIRKEISRLTGNGNLYLATTVE